MKAKNLGSVAVMAAALFGSLPNARANFVANGSFEIGGGLPIQGSRGNSLPAGSTAIASWTVINGLPADGLAWLASPNFFGPTAEDGTYMVDLTGYFDGQPYFGVSQAISTTIGQHYALTFYLGVDNSVAGCSGPISVNVIAGPASTTVVPDNPSGPGDIWTKHEVDFQASSTSSIISISGAVGTLYIGLDNVDVETAAVPEPPSIAILSTFGLLLLKRPRYRAVLV